MSNMIASEMKNDITTMSDIKIKLISRDFFNMDNLFTLSEFIDLNRLSIASVDIGIDRVIKFNTHIPAYDIITSYEIVTAMRNWIQSNRNQFTLRSILTEEELEFFNLHFGMFYQLETFINTNAIYIRI